jgi:hypothetical protein
MVMLERDRLAAEREKKAQSGSILYGQVPDVDLWELGVSLVARVLR